MEKGPKIVSIEINQCDGLGKTQIVGLVNLDKQDYDKINENIYNSVKLEKVGCFNIINIGDYKTEDIFDAYTLYSDCGSCLFSDAIDEFKSNPNVSQKFEDTRSEIQAIIQGKLAGGK